MNEPQLIFDILTIFPGMFGSALSESIIARAVEKGIVGINLSDLRDFTTDKHRSVDDYLYGGFPGMLMKCEPLARAITSVKNARQERAPKVVFLSPKGKLFNHAMALEFSRERSLVLLCGRYKGVDERIIEKYADVEVSIGDYVVSGGELPAMVLIDAVTRLLPGVLGDRESAESDSLYQGLLEPPNYTRPEEFDGVRVPEVLISGHHANIVKWQQEQSIRLTREKRPDLYEKWMHNKREIY